MRPKLLGGDTSPYVRVVRIQLIQCGLDAQVDYESVPTRVAESPLYALNPTGKIPSLALGDDLAIGEARLICGYLDGLHGGEPFVYPIDRPQDRALEGMLVGFLDGIAVWIREVRRPPGEQSPDIVRQEALRAQRCLRWLEDNVSLLRPATDYAMCCLVAALGRIDLSLPDCEWRVSHPKLAAWCTGAAELPSIAATAPG